MEVNFQMTSVVQDGPNGDFNRFCSWLQFKCNNVRKTTASSDEYLKTGSAAGLYVLFSQ